MESISEGDKLELSIEKEKKYILQKKLGIFSLQRYVFEAFKELSLEEGKWFRSTTFLMCLESLLNNETDTLKDLNLKIMNITDNIIYISDLKSKLFKEKKIKIADLSNSISDKEFTKELEDIDDDDKYDVDYFADKLEKSNISNKINFTLNY